MKQVILSAAMFFAAVLPTMAQKPEPPKQKDNTFTVDLQLRSRGEYRKGQSTLIEKDATAASFINDRVRLGIGYEHKNLSMKVAAQHTGVWGDDSQTNGNSKFGVYEAWAKLKFGCQSQFYAQFGRQTLAYDDERLLGALDWATTGRSHDALKFGWQTGIHTVNVFGAYNQNKEKTVDNLYDGTALYKTMEGVWYHLDPCKKFGASFLFLNVGIQDQTTDPKSHHMQTVGTYLNTKLGDFSGNLSGYYQFGRNVGGQKVSAFMFSINGKYALGNHWAIGIGDDYISGSDGKGDTYNTFNVLYGTHHKFYGAMDYFNNSTMPTQGLNDLNANVSYKPCKKVDLSVAYHYMALNHEVTIEDGKTKKGLGNEIDLQVNYRVQKNVTLQAGWSVMIPTKAMEAVKKCSNPASLQNWAWLSINVNPQIFKAIF